MNDFSHLLLHRARTRETMNAATVEVRSARLIAASLPYAAVVEALRRLAAAVPPGWRRDVFGGGGGAPDGADRLM